MKRTIFILLLTLSLAITVAASLDNLRTPLFEGRAPEVASPGDRIMEDQIKVFKDRIVINVENAQWARFTDTNSMDPIFDQGSNTLEIKPETPADVEVGDIISYYYGERIIVHRVTDIGTDEAGVFYTVQGDNNESNDPIKVRFDQIHGVVIGILY